MQYLIFKNIIIAVLVVLAAIALLVYICKKLAFWYVVKTVKSEHKASQIKKFKDKGLVPFEFETVELGTVTRYAVNRKNAQKKVLRDNLTLKTIPDAN